MSVALHNCIENYNILARPTAFLAEFFDNHPNIYKVALIISHLFRAAMMFGFMCIPGIPLAASIPVCFAGALFYRLTVERNCAYKFALPAFAGSTAAMLAVPAIMGMISGAAFATAGACAFACFSLLPLPLYAAYILLTVNYDVNKAIEDRIPPCCRQSINQDS